MKKIFAQYKVQLFVAVVLLLMLGCNLKRETVDDILAPVAEGIHLSIAEGGPVDVRSHRYKVHKGDTLYSIAWAVGVDYRDLAQVNHLFPPYALHEGQSVALMVRPSSHADTLRSVSLAHDVHHANATIHSEALNLVQIKRRWYWPVRGQISQHRWSAEASGESGVDITGRRGMPIKAAASGEVVYSGKGIRGYGNLIIVKHSADWLSAYAYNARRLVKTGDHVIAGQRIALMGQSPSGRPCLHFEIRHNGKPIDPLYYLATTHPPSILTRGRAVGFEGQLGKKLMRG